MTEVLPKDAYTKTARSLPKKLTELFVNDYIKQDDRHAPTM